MLTVCILETLAVSGTPLFIIHPSDEGRHCFSDLPSAAILQNELFVPTANMNEDSPQPVNEDIAGRLGTPESLETKDCTVMSPVNHPKKHPVPKTKKVGQWNYLCNFQVSNYSSIRELHVLSFVFVKWLFVNLFFCTSDDSV